MPGAMPLRPKVKSASARMTCRSAAPAMRRLTVMRWSRFHIPQKPRADRIHGALARARPRTSASEEIREAHEVLHGRDRARADAAFRSAQAVLSSPAPTPAPRRTERDVALVIRAAIVVDGIGIPVGRRKVTIEIDAARVARRFREAARRDCRRGYRRLGRRSSRLQNCVPDAPRDAAESR